MPILVDCTHTTKSGLDVLFIRYPSEFPLKKGDIGEFVIDSKIMRLRVKGHQRTVRSFNLPGENILVAVEKI